MNELKICILEQIQMKVLERTTFELSRFLKEDNEHAQTITWSAQF